MQIVSQGNPQTTDFFPFETKLDRGPTFVFFGARTAQHILCFPFEDLPTKRFNVLDDRYTYVRSLFPMILARAMAGDFLRTVQLGKMKDRTKP